MNPTPALRRALDAIAQLDAPEPPWSELLDSMRQVIGGDSATFILLEGETGLLDMQHVHIPEAAQRDYLEHFHAHDLLVPPTIGAAPGTWCDTHEVFSAGYLSGNAYYTDFMRRHGMRQMVAHIVDAGPQRRGGLTVQRSTVAPHARRHLESAPVRRAVEALRHGLARRNLRARQWLEGAESAFGAFGEALCLSTPTGTVLRASAHAHDFFAASRALELRAHRLWHPALAARQALSDGLARAARSDQPLSLSLPNGADGQDRLEVTRAAPQLSLGREPLLLLRLRAGRPAGTASIEGLSRHFGITPAEARVLAALMAGQSPRQHAEQAGVSFNTVRSQIAALMGKMECSRQSELVRKGLLAP